jgi:hypothetical protein
VVRPIKEHPMNKYAARGLLLDALEGKTIVVLAPSRRAARDAFEEFIPFEGGHVALIRASGSEQVRCTGGGCVSFAHSADALRGRRADVVFIEDDSHLDLDNALTVRAVVSTSTTGDIIRA